MIAIETKNERHKRALMHAAAILREVSMKSPSRNGQVQPTPNRRLTAERILDTLEGRRELWRLPSGAFQFRYEGVPPNSKQAELLGLFDLGATVDDIMEAIG